MAISWIKVEVILSDKPEVIRMAELLKMNDIDTVVGKLIRLWSWADLQMVRGDHVQVSCSYIDRLVFCKGFAKALMAVGWMIGEDAGLEFVNFSRHNGETTKERLGTNRRVSKFRHKNNGAGVSQKEEVEGKCNGNSVTNETGKGDFCNGGGVTDVTEAALLFPLPNPLPEKEVEFRTNRGGREIPQCMGERPPKHPPTPPPDFLNEVTGADGKPLPVFAEFVAWAKSLRPVWDVGKLSRRERELAAKAFFGLERPLSEVEKIAVAEYLAHEPERGGKFDYPPDCELFFSIMQEVVQKAMAWFRRTGRKTPAEKEEARKQAKLLKLRHEEVMVRRLAKQFQHASEELIEEIDALRVREEGIVLTEVEKERMMKGDYEL